MNNLYAVNRVCGYYALGDSYELVGVTIALSSNSAVLANPSVGIG